MPLLSIIIPVYNEKNMIEAILSRVQAAPTPGCEKKEVIVVDDGSTDGTREILKKHDGKNGIKVIFQRFNQGKGAALRAGSAASTGEMVLFQDADLEYDPSDYPALLQPVLQGKTEIVLGVRINPHPDPRRKKSFFWFQWMGNKLITWTTNWLYQNHAAEYEGCYKVFTRRVLDSIQVKANGFEFDNELVCKALKAGFKTMDVPIRYTPRDYEEGKKINWRDGFKILWSIIKYRFID